MNINRGSRLRTWPGALLVLLAVGLAITACSPEDPSARFSPSAQTLLGTGTGERILWPEEEPPVDTPAASGWLLTVALARFGELENGLASLEVILDLRTQSGAMLEMWLDTPEGPRALWRGGPTRSFGGVACWQLPLVDFEDESVVLTLDPDAEYTLVASFVDADGAVLAADSLAVTHFIPQLAGTEPGPESAVFRDLVGCRRTGK